MHLSLAHALFLMACVSTGAVAATSTVAGPHSSVAAAPEIIATTDFSGEVDSVAVVAGPPPVRWVDTAASFHMPDLAGWMARSSLSVAAQASLSCRSTSLL